jgi:hypothetical protein
MNSLLLVKIFIGEIFRGPRVKTVLTEKIMKFMWDTVFYVCASLMPDVNFFIIE